MHTLTQWTLLYNTLLLFITRLVRLYIRRVALSRATPVALIPKRCLLYCFVWLPCCVYYHYQVCKSFCLLVPLATSSGGQTCLLGKNYQLQDDDDRLSLRNIRRKWFLNVAVPTSCSGNITRYRVNFYHNNLDDDDDYDITLAVWKPIASNTYEKVSIISLV